MADDLTYCANMKESTLRERGNKGMQSIWPSLAVQDEQCISEAALLSVVYIHSSHSKKHIFAQAFSSRRVCGG